MLNTKTILAIGLLLIAGVGVWVWVWLNSNQTEELTPIIEIETPAVIQATTSTHVIGVSVQDRDIESYTFGTGETSLLFVGGIHGGYEWNSTLLAYELIDHLSVNEIVPSNITVHIIPTLNPDGLFEATNQEGDFTKEDIPDIDIHTTGIGRFNANKVDLNRNFDCRWTKESTWRSRAVSGGSRAFSEPEAIALRDYVSEINPTAAIFWHSRANNVYGSECGEAVATETLTLMSTYANAADYGEVPVFDAYVVTGAAEDWLASLGIPTVSVELESRDDSEFARNLAGTKATLELYSEIVK